MLLALFGEDILDARPGRTASQAALDRAVTRKPHGPTDRVVKDPTREEVTADQQQAGVDTHRPPAERASIVESAGERSSEPFGWVRQSHHRAARRLDPGIVR